LKKGYVMAMEVLQDKLQIINARQELIRRGVTIITGVDLASECFAARSIRPIEYSRSTKASEKLKHQPIKTRVREFHHTMNFIKRLYHWSSD